MDLLYTIQKQRVLTPEGLYVAFPFAPADGRGFYETLGGVVAPTTDIIPGAASDWQTVQSFAGMRWPAMQVVICSPEIPLVQFGGINTGKFQRQARMERAHVFSWVMNNYWTTNFCASQEGEFRWSYSLTTSSDTSAGFATRFGWSRRIPLLGRAAPGGGGDRPLERREVLPFDATNLILVGARPTMRGPGLVLHLREVDGRPARLSTSAWRMADRPVRVEEVSVLEDKPVSVADQVEFSPRQTKFLRLSPP